MQGQRAQLCSCCQAVIKDQDTAQGGWIFFNLHFLNYSKSCQVHTHNRKVTNPAVILKTRRADAVTLILKLFSGGKEEVDWITCSQPCGRKGAGMTPFQGEIQIKHLLYTGGHLVQAVLWNPAHPKVQDPGTFSAVAARTLIEARNKINVPSACKLLLTST